MIATLLAMLCANSPMLDYYEHFLDTPFELRLGSHYLAKPVLLWINDGLMAVFFFLIGLEVKREVLIGQLSSRAQIILPGIAALGGMIVPALVYVVINAGDSTALNGWAIPAATDIAFAVAALAVFGSRVPSGLKVFLLALAIVDDLGAVTVIAVFYTQELSLTALAAAAGGLALAFAMRFDYARKLAFRTISQIGIRYPRSRLSLALEGSPRGGPRSLRSGPACPRAPRAPRPRSRAGWPPDSRSAGCRT